MRALGSLAFPWRERNLSSWPGPPISKLFQCQAIWLPGSEPDGYSLGVVYVLEARVLAESTSCRIGSPPWNKIPAL
jgi:hypothetical protein